MSLSIQILPSLLAGDFGHLADSARRAEDGGADQLHLDIMDAHFVPNLSMGPDVVRMARAAVSVPLNVHLMMTRPDRYVDVFADAGADTILIHIETQAAVDVPATLRRIRERGARPGITLNPDTPAERVFPVLPEADEALCMTVFPGYGGQAFMPEVLPTIRALRDHAADRDRPLDIMVDGGINDATAARCAAAGANFFVAGTSLFGADDMRAAIARMRRSARDAFQP